MQLDDVDWDGWIPHDVAAVTYLTTGRRLLLIHKKRGLGEGMINAPGGRLERAETPAEAAVREFEEEVGLRITAGLREVGEHRHQFVDGLRLQIHAFVAETARGAPIETDEAVPFWVDRDEVPFHRMWADNRLWLPQVLDGAYATGRFVFDGSAMLDFDIRLRPGVG